MMTPREIILEPARSALRNAMQMHINALKLGQVAGLPATGMDKTLGVGFATLIRAMNGKLVPTLVVKKVNDWYIHAGRFLPKIED